MSLEKALAYVRAFHEACDVPVLDRPEFPDGERAKLRMRLIDEEANEIEEAMRKRDLAGLTQELADMIYVTVGCAIEFGLPLNEVFAAVHEANMAKVDPNSGKVLKREDGKVLKPDGWQPADVKSIVEARAKDGGKRY